METAASFRLAEAAQRLSAAARRHGWAAPGFRSPPGVLGVNRTIRRDRRGGAVVAVAVRDRRWSEVQSDLVEGVIVVNRLLGDEAARCRSTLWEALAGSVVEHTLGEVAA